MNSFQEVGASASPRGECDFLCPGDSGLCIPADLVCNGVVNCPGAKHNESGGDEGPDTCAARAEPPPANWTVVGLGALGGALLALACLALACRLCCPCCSKSPDDTDY